MNWKGCGRKLLCNPASLWRDLGKPRKTSVQSIGVHTEIGTRFLSNTKFGCHLLYWDVRFHHLFRRPFSASSNCDVPPVTCIFMSQLTVLCSAMRSLFTSFLLLLCLLYFPLLFVFSSTYTFLWTCHPPYSEKPTTSERRLLQKQNECLLCWQPFIFVQYFKIILFFEAFGLSNSGADILVCDVILEI